MKTYHVISPGEHKSFKAGSDQEAALVVAVLGDFGFTDKYGLEKFPATWTREEWTEWLGCPLEAYLSTMGAKVATTVASLS